MTALRRERDAVIVDDVLARYADAGHATVGLAPTMYALGAGAVQELLLTQRFIAERPASAETAVRQAFAKDALVEVVSGAGAERLDAEGGGIGARLRFIAYRPTPGSSATAA